MRNSGFFAGFLSSNTLMDRIAALSSRLDRLERQNRLLKTAVAIGAVALIVGWKAGTPELIQAHQFQVVDERGVPLVTLAAARNGVGGSIILRDSLGEKRTWWEAAPDSARFVLDSPASKGQGDTVAGLAATSTGARASLLGPTGASVEAQVQNDKPRLSLSGAHGESLFSAPWQK